ncbi:alpha/beta hydrolase [Nostoc flagelliforme FACHB-838]|uniref:Alpha/beta hydrolase n=1 Tax=Nostoc flagelliforme FACHB-838 TaxID=2692904 RepID=A0ABR8E3H6_9NOSO|nr:alpha/beta hydrolase [Nostoc flagelliforme]MBD2536136.1 alpha/beta hydrolase [Nostoc flagelliforme FACHB-838]
MNNKWYSKIVVATASLVIPLIQLLAVSLVSTTPAAASDRRTICKQIKQVVSLIEGQPPNYEVVGELCYKPNHKNVVHLLISGATYGSVYWDFPLHPQRYSYVRALTNVGYATLNLERIGIGKSDRPIGSEVTMQANAFVVHQIVQALRDGRLGEFSKIILVGHSLGSGVAILAAQYNDVDGLILTSFLHAQGPGYGDVGTSLYPAQQDPRFQEQNLPYGYLTTFPGKRTIFYSIPNTDPDVIALDESTKETFTIGEGNTFAPIVTSPNNVQSIRVPVLIVIGQFDNIFCTPSQCLEAPVEPTYYKSSPSVEVKVIKNAGHNLNLHRNAPAFFATAIAWSNRVFYSQCQPWKDLIPMNAWELGLAPDIVSDNSLLWQQSINKLMTPHSCPR